MASEAEVLSIARKLNKFIDNSEDDVDVLQLLKSLNSVPMTIDILQKTRVGMTVNQLRKQTKDADVTSLAKSLVKSWKKLLGNQKNGNGDLNSSQSTTDSQTINDSQDSMDSTDVPEPAKRQKFDDDGSPANGKADSAEDDEDATGSPKELEKAQSAPGGSSSKPELTLLSLPRAASATNDTYRLKCREMLLKALQCSEMPDGTQEPEQLSAQIEDALYDLHKGTNKNYMAGVRSRVFNLRDKKNPHLRCNVLTGVISPKRLAEMTAEQMASDEVRHQREKFTKEAINEHQMVIEEGTATELFICGKCRSKKCTYTQAQTRSADEPMTTFVLCMSCGNRWKFS